MSIFGAAETAVEGATGAWWLKPALILLSVIGVCGAFGWVVHQRDAARADSLVWQGRFREEKLAFAGTVANYRAATASAQAADLAHARAVEQADARASQETQDDLVKVRDNALAAAARYAAELRLAGARAADRGSGGQPGLPSLPDATLDADRAGEDAVMATDLAACSEAVVKAQGWQGWYATVAAVPR